MDKKAQIRRRKIIRRRRRIIISILLLPIIIYLSYKMVMGIFFSENAYYTVEYDVMNLDKTYQAYILRNELLVSADDGGIVTFLEDDGVRVKKGGKVAEISIQEGNTNLIADADEETLLLLDWSRLDEEITNLYDALLVAQKGGETREVQILSEQLRLKLEKREKMLLDDEKIKSRAASFKEELVELSGQKAVLSAPAAGILSYYIDDYEDYLTLDNLYNIDYETLDDLDIEGVSSNNQYIPQEEPIFKVVDNASIYLVMLITKDEIDLYKQMSKAIVQIESNNIVAQIHDVFIADEKGVLVLKITETFDGFYNTRKVDINLIQENFQGLKVLKSSIFMDNGVQGVYMLDYNNKVVFMPVKVIGFDQEYAIIYNEYFYETVDGEETLVKTVAVFDEVIINPEAYKEGDQIN